MYVRKTVAIIKKNFLLLLMYYQKQGSLATVNDPYQNDNPQPKTFNFGKIHNELNDIFYANYRHTRKYLPSFHFCIIYTSLIKRSSHNKSCLLN